MTPEEYLLSKGFKLRTAPGQWQTQCPFCGDKNPYGHLYVNREHGAWMCHRCQEKGGFYDLQVKLGDSPSPASKQWAQKQDVWAAFVKICETNLSGSSKHMDYLFNERGLKAGTISEWKLGYVPNDAIRQLRDQGFSVGEIGNAGLLSDNGNILFYDRLLLPYFDGSRVIAMRAKQLGGNVLQAKNTSIRLFGLDKIRGRKEVFICEGELDAIYLNQLGYAACAIPGAASFQEHWVSYFDDALRVFVVLDADDAGRKGSLKIESFLGHRARLIDLPVPDGEKSTDVTEYFLRDGNSIADFEDLVAELRGRRVFTLADAYHEQDKLRGKKGVQTRVGDLDDLISPGLLPGQVVTILAKTGTGKTAFATQLVHNLSSWEAPGYTPGEGVPILVLSLEQTKPEVAERLTRIGRFYNPWAKREDLNRWHSMMRINDDNRVPPTDVPLLIDEFIDEVGVPPKVLLVDYLGYWSRSFKGGSSYERVSEAIMELKRLAKDTETIVITPHQVSRLQKRGEGLDLDNARDSGAVEETSDFVLGLFKPKEADVDDDEEEWYNRAETRLQILKSRHGNQGKQISLLWNPWSLSLTPNTDSLTYERTKTEWEYHDLRLKYEDVLKAHQSELPNEVLDASDGERSLLP